MNARGFWLVLGACLFAPLLAPVAGSVQSQPARIIALGGDITEIIYRLGEQQRLAGRDATSMFPPEARALPDVGYFRQLGAEGVLSLKPDLIVASATAGHPQGACREAGYCMTPCLGKHPATSDEATSAGTNRHSPCRSA
jgi:ABC-type hemin transport system substrate-binding protein